MAIAADDICIASGAVMTLQHGGQLRRMAKQFNIPVEDWIDLSTGINPEGWPVPEIPADIFNRLPEEDDGLEEVAQKYYKAESLLPVAGSQAVIQCLPKLRQRSVVAIPAIGYAEHYFHWNQAGHEIVTYHSSDIDTLIDKVDVVVVINPNNPNGDKYTSQQLLHYHEILSKKGGWLIVDEAFIDTETTNSLAPYSHLNGIIVLRSIGKFFGLAGIRSGFVCAENNLLQLIEHMLGPWSLSNPARYITKLALADINWQNTTRSDLKVKAAEFTAMIKNTVGIKPQGCELFKTVYCENSESYYLQLAEKGLLCRLLDNKQGLRFGLPESSDFDQVRDILISVFVNANHHIETA